MTAPPPPLKQHKVMTSLPALLTWNHSHGDGEALGIPPLPPLNQFARILAPTRTSSMMADLMNNNAPKHF